MDWTKDLQFDQQNFDEIAAQAKTARETINDSMKKVLENLEKLRTDWNTPAGKYFFGQIDLKWTDDVKKCLKTFETLEEVMKKAKEHYQKVEEAVNQVKLD